MKAIQMSEQGGPEVLQLGELPDPQPGPGEVLIKVDAAAVNFSDLMRRRGDVYPVPTPVPFVPGAEVAGTVAALGDGCASVQWVIEPEEGIGLPFTHRSYRA